jgi:hypothetical protein
MFTPADEKACETIRKGRAAVYYGDRYICAVDRGGVPEIKVYGVKDGIIPMPMSDINKYDDSKVTFLEILPTSHLYETAVSKVERGDDNYTRSSDGRVFLYEAMRFGKVRGDVQKLGWRHTFEALLNRQVPGVTRSSLSRKFNVDMLKYPVGTPEEVHDAVLAE